MASDVRLFVTPGVSSPVVQQSDNNPSGTPLRGTRDGSAITQDWVTSMVSAGFGFMVNYGVGSTPINGTTGFTIGLPMGNLDVPVGRAVIPIMANCYLQTSAGTLSNVIFAYSVVLMGNGTSTAAAQGPKNLRTDSAIASLCTARQAYSGAGAVVAANQAELLSGGYPFADATAAPEKRWEWTLESKAFPILIGPASFQIYAVSTTTTPTGKAQLKFLEVPSNYIV